MNRPFVSYLARVIPSDMDLSRGLIDSAVHLKRAKLALSRCGHGDVFCEHHERKLHCERYDLLLQEYVQDVARMRAETGWEWLEDTQPERRTK